MRVMHIMAGKGNGGAEIYSTDVMLALHQRGVDQCVVINNQSIRADALRGAGVRLSTGIFKWPFRLLQALHLRHIIKQEKPDIICCWMRYASSLITLAAPECKNIIGWFGNYKTLKNFKNCSHFVGVTQSIVDFIKKDSRHTVHATYIPTFPSIDDAPAINRATLDTPKDATVLLALSRLHPKKGLDTLMHAIVDMPDVYVWLAGDGPLEHELKALAEKLGLTNRVRFLGWRTDRAALMHAADICVLPSRYEPFGTVILEAWLMQIPLVTCASDGPAAYIRNGINGMISPIDDIDALATNLRAVMDDEILRTTIIANGYAEYRASYTREIITQQWLDYLQNLSPVSTHTTASGT
jgi:glycosyltransferase involved in cell wall biosynthesis